MKNFQETKFEIIKAVRWDGKENGIDQRDRAASEAASSSIVSKEQLQIDKGKVKKVKDKVKNFVSERIKICF